MKRWIAGVLAAMMLLAAGPAAAEEDGGLSNADIVESLQTREQHIETLADDLRMVNELLRDKDFRSLLQIKDVQDVLNEGIYRILAWMLHNRPVTMKILAELGVGERDLRCIGKIWDSAERFSDAWDAWEETEHGRQTKEAVDALNNDPEFRKSLDDCLETLSSGDVAPVMDSIGSALQAETPAAGGEAFTDELMMKLESLTEEKEGSMAPLHSLLQNENLKHVILLLSEDNEMDSMIREEIRKLAEDEETHAFILQSAQAAADLYRELHGGEQADSEEAAP